MDASSWNRPAVGQVMGTETANGEQRTLTSSFKSGVSISKTAAYEKNNPDWVRASKHELCYQTWDELKLLYSAGKEEIDKFQPGAVLVDFGSGCTEKIEPLLKILEAKGIWCSYICLDISRTAVQNGVSRLLDLNFKFVQVSGRCQSFSDGLEYLKGIPFQRVAIYMGSTLYNDGAPTGKPTEDSTARELYKATRPGDLIFVGQDCHSIEDKDKIEASYHHELFLAFMHALKDRASRELGVDPDVLSLLCDLEQLDSGLRGLHHSFKIRLEREIVVPGGEVVEAGTLLDLFRSYKSTPELMVSIFKRSRFRVKAWRVFRSYLFLLEHETESERERESEAPATCVRLN